MKLIFMWMVVLASALPAFSQIPLLESDDGESRQHDFVFNPQQELEFRKKLEQTKSFDFFRFAQTKWNECSDNPTGNYYQIRCSRIRGISVILKRFLRDNIFRCVDDGLRAQGLSSASRIHIIHDGIQGDPRHSPRSLHAESRAIDIKAIRVKFRSGNSKTLTFAGNSSRRFYNAFRSCWGGVVNRQNGCPYYKGNRSRTGTIGKEDRNHQRHMHTSVPHCFSGRYGSYYYRR